MKKSLLLLGVAVAAITSCTNDEVLDINKNTTITFDGHVNKGTRAVTSTTTGDLKQFYVFGNHGTTVDFNNVVVKKNASTLVWECATNVPWTDQEYYFAAYATTNTSEQITPAYADGALTFSDIVANDASDLVAATKTVNNAGMPNAAVSLTFKHLLSKVNFAITNGSSEYKLKVSNITFNVVKQGDCVFSNAAAATWTTDGTASALSFAGGETAKSGVYTSEDHLVIPNQALTNVKASFTVSFYNDADEKVYEKQYTGSNSVSLALTSGLWQPGYSYVYTATVSPATSYITFSVQEVEEWKPATPGMAL